MFYDLKTGQMLYGKEMIDGLPYEFNSITGAMKTGWIEYDGHKFYYGSTGAVTGEVAIDGYWYYFNEDSNASSNNPKGAMQTGLVVHHNNTYYYDNTGKMKYGEQSFDGNWYYFDSTLGVMRTGWVNHDNKTYYYDKDGKMLHGWNEVEGIVYLFDNVTGAFKPGWRKEEGKVYYYENNQKYIGEKAIDGEWYYFSESETSKNTLGEMVVGWSIHHGNQYYYKTNGQMAHDWYRIEGVDNYFGKTTGIYEPGLKKQNGKVYYYIDGKKYTGERYVDGNWYYFNEEDGMVYGWWNLQGRKVYYGTDGAMCYGEQAIDGKWYYFDMITGAMQTGWRDFPGKRVYYGMDGAMVYGTQVIDGRTYKFNAITGALITNEMTMKAQIYNSNTNWLILVDTRQNRVGIYQGTYNNWNEIKYWTCTSGAASTPTVKGEFRVTGRGMSFGKGYTCWYYTQFYGNYLFHSVLYHQGSMTQIKDGRLGINASHGCVRLDINNAKWIYDNIPNGTKVVIY